MKGWITLYEVSIASYGWKRSPVRVRVSDIAIVGTGKSDQNEEDDPTEGYIILHGGTRMLYLADTADEVWEMMNPAEEEG